jgi:uncharacterized protein
MDADLRRKHQAVLDVLGALDGAVVAFSGGVDSTLLLRLGRDALNDRCVALTAVSPSFPERERREAETLARSLGVRHVWVESKELERGPYARNPSNRCYFCRSELFDHCFHVMRDLGLGHVVYGATVDDLGDHRPGMQAAKERGVRAPLLEAGLTKAEIRALSRRLELPTWDKPAMACLSSRIPTGVPITRERLGRVEQAENALRDEGLREVRVRFHGETARIEVGEAEWGRFAEPALRRRVARALHGAGFRFVTLDLMPYQSGRLNTD